MSVSIIIPVHNSMKYLDECLQSVFNQIETDDEIILIENGSIDDTPKKCKEYIQFYNNIKYIELGDVGVSVARNEGIKAATKEWITFLDSDDMLQKGAFNRIKKTSTDEAEIIIGGYSRKEMDNTMESAISKVDSYLLAKGVLQFAKYKKQLQKIAPIDDYNNWACWGKFYSRNFLIKNKIFFPEGIKLSEDIIFCFISYYFAKKIYATQQRLYFYRLNESSSINVNYKDKILSNNSKLLAVILDLRETCPISKSWEKEYSALIAVKTVDIVLALQKDERKTEQEKLNCILSICQRKEIASAINKAPLIYLINGKKNALKYGRILFKLKTGNYKNLFN